MKKNSKPTQYTSKHIIIICNVRHTSQNRLHFGCAMNIFTCSFQSYAMGDKNLLLLRSRIPLLVDEGVCILMLAYEAKDFIPRANNGEDRRHGHIEFYEGMAILNTTH